LRFNQSLRRKNQTTVRNLRRLIQLFDHDIDVEERTGISDLAATSSYSATAWQIGAGRGKLSRDDLRIGSARRHHLSLRVSLPARARLAKKDKALNHPVY
jgi:hypothetical protein